MMNKENFYQQKQQINYNNSNNQEQYNMSQRDLFSQEYVSINSWKEPFEKRKAISSKFSFEKNFNKFSSDIIILSSM